VPLSSICRFCICQLFSQLTEERSRQVFAWKRPDIFPPKKKYIYKGSGTGSTYPYTNTMKLSTTYYYSTALVAALFASTVVAAPTTKSSLSIQSPVSGEIYASGQNILIGKYFRL
jgi:hypothetical protein